MIQKFNFSIEIPSTMPGCWIEETFSGCCYIPKNDDDDWPALEQLFRNGVEIDFPPNGVSPNDWDKFETLCIQSALDAQWSQIKNK
jgi:hypothetical protein